MIISARHQIVTHNALATQTAPPKKRASTQSAETHVLVIAVCSLDVLFTITFHIARAKKATSVIHPQGVDRGLLKVSTRNIVEFFIHSTNDGLYLLHGAKTKKEQNYGSSAPI